MRPRINQTNDSYYGCLWSCCTSLSSFCPCALPAFCSSLSFIISLICCVLFSLTRWPVPCTCGVVLFCCPSRCGWSCWFMEGLLFVPIKMFFLLLQKTAHVNKRSDHFRDPPVVDAAQYLPQLLAAKAAKRQTSFWQGLLFP